MKRLLIGRIAALACGIAIAAGIGFVLPKNLKADVAIPEAGSNTIPTASTIKADTTYYGEITQDDTIDYYKLVLPSSGRIKFTMNFSKNFYFNIYNSDEENIWGVDETSGERRMNVDLNKGTYYLRIAHGWWNSDVGTYNFYYKFLPSGESFPETGKGSNNLMSTANTIALNKIYKAFIATNDELDYYKFTLNAPGKINITLNVEDGNEVAYYILDKNGNEELDKCYASAGENKRSITLSKGVHYIEFVQYYSRTGTFNFTLGFEGIKFAEDTKTVVCGNQTTLSVENAGRNKVTWKSSSKAIAQVSSDGVIMANKAGPVTIMATVDGTTIKRNIQVLYKDVTDPDKFWYEPTNALTNKGIVQGYDRQTTFKPENNCTRAQMVTFLWRLKGTPNPKASTTKFKDVKKSAYYYKAVIWATEKGITTGYSKTSFKPNNVCTRAQTVTFLWRMAGKPTPKTKTNKFKDIGSKDYFYKAVLWASEKKIVEGYKNKTFRPQNKCTRRQMVTFLYKYSKNVK